MAMHNIVAVYHALRSFDRPATRAELERECGLDKAQVWRGLLGLMRHGKLLVDVEPRKAGVYRLAPGATPPEEIRGQYDRDPEHRQRMAKARRPNAHAPQQHAAQTAYRAAKPASHCSQPGALRTMSRPAADLCALAHFWPKR